MRALLLLTTLLLPACNGLFYHPRPGGGTPVVEGAREPESVMFESADGTRLHGWFLKPMGPVRGTVVHFHGNAGNVSGHVRLVDWLPAEGFQVFAFDYRGYGRSQGSPDRGGVHADGRAALDYVRSRADVDAERMLVLGQSLGGAIAVASLGEGDATGVCGVAVESTFGSYRSVANSKLGGTFLTYPLVWLLVSGDHDPEDSVGRLAGTPLLVAHGTDDWTVTRHQGRELFDAAREPKEWVDHAGGGHLHFLGTAFGRRTVLDFFERCLEAADR